MAYSTFLCSVICLCRLTATFLHLKSRSSKTTLKDIRSYDLLVTSYTDISGTHSPMLRLPRVQFPA